MATIGVYVTCDDALCRKCFIRPGYKWPGFENWSEPLDIDDDSSPVDSPVHCSECGVLLETPLTDEGWAYVGETVFTHMAEVAGGEGRNPVTDQWVQQWIEELTERFYRARVDDAWRKPELMHFIDWAMWTVGKD